MAWPAGFVWFWCAQGGREDCHPVSWRANSHLVQFAKFPANYRIQQGYGDMCTFATNIVVP